MPFYCISDLIFHFHGYATHYTSKTIWNKSCFLPENVIYYLQKKGDAPPGASPFSVFKAMYPKNSSHRIVPPINNVILRLFERSHQFCNPESAQGMARTECQDNKFLFPTCK